MTPRTSPVPKLCLRAFLGRHGVAVDEPVDDAPPIPGIVPNAAPMPLQRTRATSCGSSPWRPASMPDFTSYACRWPPRCAGWRGRRAPAARKGRARRVRAAARPTDRSCRTSSAASRSAGSVPTSESMMPRQAAARPRSGALPDRIATIEMPKAEKASSCGAPIESMKERRIGTETNSSDCAEQAADAARTCRRR